MLCLIFSVSFDMLNMTRTGVKKVYKLFKFVIVIDLHCVSCFCGLLHVEYHQNMCKKGFKNCLSVLGYERVYPSLCKVADTPFHIRGDIIQKYSYLWLISNLSVFPVFAAHTGSGRRWSAAAGHLHHDDHPGQSGAGHRLRTPTPHTHLDPVKDVILV